MGRACSTGDQSSDVICTDACPDLVMAPGPSAAFVFDNKLTDYAAVDVNVLISFTRNSLLIKRRQVCHCLLTWRLQYAPTLRTHDANRAGHAHLTEGLCS